MSGALPVVVLGLCCALLGTPLVIHAWFTLFKWSLNTEAFNGLVLRLLKQGQPERCVKLCHAVPDALLPASLRPALDEALRLKPQVIEMGRALETLAALMLEATGRARRRVALAMGLLVALVPLLGLTGWMTWVDPPWLGGASFAPERHWPLLVALGGTLLTALGVKKSLELLRDLKALPQVYLPALGLLAVGQTPTEWEIHRALDPSTEKPQTRPPSVEEAARGVDGFQLHPTGDRQAEAQALGGLKTGRWPVLNPDAQGWRRWLARHQGEVRLMQGRLFVARHGEGPVEVALGEVRSVQLQGWEEAGQRRVTLVLALATRRVSLQARTSARIASLPRLRSGASTVPPECLEAIWAALQRLEAERGYDLGGWPLSSPTAP